MGPDQDFEAFQAVGDAVASIVEPLFVIAIEGRSQGGVRARTADPLSRRWDRRCAGEK